MSVYFATSGPYLKIGFSADPLRRIATVTTAGTRPSDLPRATDADLIGWIPGDREAEATWHRHFAADHVAGEWFYLERRVAEEIIWDDPCGIDIHRMSALAVMAADRYDGISRAELDAMGIIVEAAPERDVLDAIDRQLQIARGAA